MAAGFAAMAQVLVVLYDIGFLQNSGVSSLQYRGPRLRLLGVALPEEYLPFRVAAEKRVLGQWNVQLVAYSAVVLDCDAQGCCRT